MPRSSRKRFKCAIIKCVYYVFQADTRTLKLNSWKQLASEEGMQHFFPFIAHDRPFSAFSMLDKMLNWFCMLFCVLLKLFFLLLFGKSRGSDIRDYPDCL